MTTHQRGMPVFAEPPMRAPTEDRGPSDVMPRILRVVGAALLVFAASSFMFRDWGQSDDVTRYLTLLGQLVLLAGAGFFCGLKLKEKRGARTFLGLVIAVVPVHFAVLGGVVYSQLALDAPHSDLPAYAIWHAGDPTTAIVLALAAQLVLLPATFIAMMTLARKHALPLTLAFIAVNALLLVPVRDPNTIAMLVAGATAIVLVLQLRVFAGAATLRTPQARFVRAMLATPLLILVGRTLLYYPLTPALLGVVFMLLGLASFASDKHADGGRALPGFSVTQLFAVGAMLLGWLVAISEIPVEHLMRGGFHTFDIPLIMLPWAAIILVASHFVVRGALNYRRMGALTALAAVGLHVLVFHELAPSLLCLLVGLAVMAYGARIEQKLVLAIGAATSVIGLVAVGLLTIRVDALTHWTTLTAVGVALIFGAAALDRNRQRLLHRLGALEVRMQRWSY